MAVRAAAEVLVVVAAAAEARDPGRGDRPKPGAQPAGGVTFEEEEPDYAGLGIGAGAQFFSLP